MPTERSYSLPNGKRTTSAKRYAREWTRLGKPVAKALGCRLIALDPSFLLGPLSGAPAFTIPVSVAQRIKALL